MFLLMQLLMEFEEGVLKGNALREGRISQHASGME